MTTKIINIKEYRDNITSLWKEAKAKKIKYIVLVHSKPAFEVKPLNDDFMIDEVEIVPTAAEIKAYRHAMADFTKNKNKFVDGGKFLNKLIKKKHV